MKLEELDYVNVGNYLEVDGSIIEVGKINNNSISWKLNSKKNDIVYWNPFIPITDDRVKPITIDGDILDKLGFVETKTKDIYEHKDLPKVYITTHGDVRLFFDCRLIPISNELHILQNTLKFICKYKLKFRQND